MMYAGTENNYDCECDCGICYADRMNKTTHVCHKELPQPSKGKGE